MDFDFQARVRRFTARIRPPFRGGAVANLGSAPMAKGHGNDGKPFDLETACYLKPVFAEYDLARRLGQRLLLALKAGVKTVKSFTLEVCAAEHVCHAQGDAAIFFATGETADVGATTRILDFFRGILAFAKKIATLASRFDDTKGALKFPDKTLFILSANLSNTQQKNLAFVGLQDAFLTEATGMIAEMTARTTQYAKTAIIFIESQGGEKGYDFDRMYDGTDQRELHVNCPCCGVSHLWNWKAWDMTRDDKFEAVLPIKTINEIKQKYAKETQRFQIQQTGSQAGNPSVSPVDTKENANPNQASAPQSAVATTGISPAEDSTGAYGTGDSGDDGLGAAIAEAQKELTATLKSEARRRCGFKRGPDELIKLPDGSYNEREVLRQTHFECYHCGGIWRDDGEFGATRVGLDQSSHYVAANPKALSYNVGFNIPQWINRRLPWGEMMLKKLQAQRVANELGNFEELKKWWQKTAAKTWDDEMMSLAPARIAASLYDDKQPLPGEKARIAAADFQLNGTHIPYLAWAIGDGTPPRLLHYEWVKADNRPEALFLPYGEKVLEQLHTGCETDALKREFCKARVRELNAHFGIEQQNFMIDAAHRPDLVREWAAEDAVYARIREVGTGRVTQKWITYGLLFGDDPVSFRWHNPGRKATWERYSPPYTVLVDTIREGRKIKIPVSHKKWSNLSIKDIACRWRDGDGAPRIQVAEKFLADTSKDGFQKQMTSERKLPVKNSRHLKRYEKIRPENHFWDCFCMVLVRMDILQYLNSFGPPEADTAKDEG